MLLDWFNPKLDESKESAQSVESPSLIRKHPFLTNAKAASKLAPRVRLAIEASRIDVLNMNREFLSGRLDTA